MTLLTPISVRRVGSRKGKKDVKISKIRRGFAVEWFIIINFAVIDTVGDFFIFPLHQNLSSQLVDKNKD